MGLSRPPCWCQLPSTSCLGCWHVCNHRRRPSRCPHSTNSLSARPRLCEFAGSARGQAASVPEAGRASPVTERGRRPSSSQGRRALGPSSQLLARSLSASLLVGDTAQPSRHPSLKATSHPCHRSRQAGPSQEPAAHQSPFGPACVEMPSRSMSFSTP